MTPRATRAERRRRPRRQAGSDARGPRSCWSLAALGTSWSSYQATPLERRAGGRGEPHQRRPDRAPPGAQGLSEAQTQVDVATFIQWVDAYALDRQELMPFSLQAFPQGISARVSPRGLLTKPLKNPKAPLTPFAMPQYKLAATTEARRLDAAAEVSAWRDIQRGSNYVLGVVSRYTEDVVRPTLDVAPHLRGGDLGRGVQPPCLGRRGELVLGHRKRGQRRFRVFEWLVSQATR